jgi:GxxExxY protein
MPIIPSIPIVTSSQERFGKLAYDVMHHVFAIHDEYGRFCDELIYKRELARRMSGLELEVRIDVVHDSFTKTYFADAIAEHTGLFEFKAAETIHPRHIAQATHYLLLLGLHHGKVINMRTESVEHQFVNIHSKLSDLRNPEINDTAYLPNSPGAKELRDLFLGLISDWGTGLDIALYEEAITHFLGGESIVFKKIPINGTGGDLAHQHMHLAHPNSVFKITSFTSDSSSQSNFRVHAQKLLNHTPLQFIQWINVQQRKITFTTILRD